MGIQFSLFRPMITKTGTGKIVRTQEEIATLYGIGVKKLVNDTRAKKSYYPQPGTKPLYIPMGYEGPSLKIQAAFIVEVIDGVPQPLLSAYQSWDVCRGGDLLMVVSNCYNPNSQADPETAYHELPNSSYWWLDDLQFNRGAGYGNRWDLEMDLIRCWYDSDGNPIEG
jgi:hypothetical protein